MAWEKLEVRYGYAKKSKQIALQDFFMRKSDCTNFYTTVWSFHLERQIWSHFCVESKKTEQY